MVYVTELDMPPNTLLAYMKPALNIEPIDAATDPLPPFSSLCLPSF